MRSQVIAVEPRGKGPRGSGAVIQPGLLLTAWHVAESAGEAYNGSQSSALEIAWCDPENDLALMHCDRAFPVSPLCLGMVCSDSPDLAAEALGFPLSQRKGEIRNIEQVTGTINPASGVQQRLHFTVQSGYWEASTLAEGKTPWGGISGGPVLSNDLLIGVVKAGRKSPPFDRLEVAAVTPIWNDKDARKLLIAAGGGGLPAIRAVEFGKLPRSLKYKHEYPINRDTPSVLLEPYRQAIAFKGRRSTRSQLSQWCKRPGFEIGVLSGPVGSGKSRVACVLGQDLARDGWAVERLVDGMSARLEAADLRRLHRLAVPTLLIVDDPETRVHEIADLAAHLAYNKLTPVKVLLCARGTGLWWETLRMACTAELGDEAFARFELDGESPAVDEITELARAAKTFNRILTSMSRATFEDASQAGLLDPNVLTAQEDHPGVLSVHALALGWALRLHGHGDMTEPLDQLINVEIRRLASYARAFGATMPMLEEVAEFLAALLFFGVRTLSSAERLHEIMSRRSGLPRSIVRAIAELYPGNGCDIDPMPIRVLAGRLLAHTLLRSPTALLDLFPLMSPEEQTRALALLFRLAGEHAEIAELVAAHLQENVRIPFEDAAAIGAMTTDAGTLEQVLGPAYRERGPDIERLIAAASDPGNARQSAPTWLWPAYVRVFALPNLQAVELARSQQTQSELIAAEMLLLNKSRAEFDQIINKVKAAVRTFDSTVRQVPGQLQELGGILSNLHDEVKKAVWNLNDALRSLPEYEVADMRGAMQTLETFSAREGLEDLAMRLNRAGDEQIHNITTAMDPLKQMVREVEEQQKQLRQTELKMEWELEL
ncbi:S1 family peptidase [Catelliglobosispora koreensis]|uniref:S1 family peptidase n=1 Tax=Catelliglobosispora koreensis TaxID=129052 RepID=UPI0003A9C804|nr:serine protease [Catelliglobosispora koreensis]